MTKKKQQKTEESKGIVYLASNPCFPDWVKVGVVESCDVAKLKRRLKQHSGTNVPEPFELHYAVIVDNPIGEEEHLLAAYDGVRENKKREFLKIDPDSVRVAMERFGGEEVKLDWESNISPDEIPSFLKARKSADKKRGNFRFAALGIPIGAKLIFVNKESAVCEVVENNQVKYEGAVMSLSAAANAVLATRGVTWGAAGPRHWKYEGETLHDLRGRLEEESE